MFNVALWDTPLAAYLASGFTDTLAGRPLHLQHASSEACDRLLRSGKADVALLPTFTVLADASYYDVVPGIALSTWNMPFAKLLLKAGLGGPIRTLALDPAHPEEAFVAQVILKEHYGATPTLVSYEGRTEDLATADEDAVLRVGPDVAHLQSDRVVMDLSQEWYELVNYPMVWGVMAARKGELEPAVIEGFIEAAVRAEKRRPVWLQTQETTPELYDFYRHDLRVRLDDLATASVTELRQYLYYYNVTEDIPDFPVAYLPADDED